MAEETKEDAANSATCQQAGEAETAASGTGGKLLLGMSVSNVKGSLGEGVKVAAAGHAVPTDGNGNSYAAGKAKRTWGGKRPAQLTGRPKDTEKDAGGNK